MKHTPFILAIASSLVLIACSPSKSTTTTTTTRTSEADNAALGEDKIEFYETEYEVRQEDYLAQLAGEWTVNTMQRQSMLPVESLSDISIRLNSDKTFEVGLRCGTLTGTYSLKGTSIKFLTDGNADCSNNEQMSELIRLLTQRVSAYTVENRSLLLRDGSSNIIFKASKVY